MSESIQDEVRREVVIRASKERVYAALTQVELFTKWWPKAIEGTLEPGQKPLLDFGEAGKCRFFIVAAEPHHYFAYRWAQGAVSPEETTADPLTLPNTLVEFRLEEVKGGTRVTVTESGLSKLPEKTRKQLESMGGLAGVTHGWREILKLLERNFQNP
ncbi:MAG TPA: SRPBCC domain-containing protein [Planctomycetota bacterium]|nr:SRPBCC domain-containing protein [Planctomycetota bacterium]